MAQTPDLVRLDATRLLDLISKHEFKQYWLAEQIGVDKRTMTRWISGSVKWIKRENIDALAKLLNCSGEELAVKGNDSVFATPVEHAEAAQAIASQHLVFQLSPSGKWQLAETVLKSALQPDLPLKVLADLYLQLCEAMWKQNKIEQGFLYSQKAEDIAEKSNSPEIATQVALQTGIMLSKLGRYSESVDMFEDALANPVLEYYPGPKAPLLANQSVNYMDLGDFEKSARYLQQSHEAYLKTPYPKWLQAFMKTNRVGILLMEKKNEEAWELLLETEAFAKEAGYQPGLNFLSILRGVLEARRGDLEAGMKSFEDGFSKMQFGDSGLYEAMGAEVYRLAGNRERVEELVKKGLKAESNLYRALNLEQLALFQRDAGELEAGRQTLNRIKPLMNDPLLETRWQMFKANFG